MTPQAIQNVIDNLTTDRDTLAGKLVTVNDNITTQNAKRAAFEARIDTLDRTIAAMEELKTAVN